MPNSSRIHAAACCDRRSCRRRGGTGFPTSSARRRREIFVGGPAIARIEGRAVSGDREEARHQGAVRGHELADQPGEDARQQGPSDHDGDDDGRSRPHPGRAREADREAAGRRHQPRRRRSPDAKPRDGMWANWCQPMCSVSHNTKALPNGLASYADAWDQKFKEKIIVISMRITQAIAPLVAATHLVDRQAARTVP